jgi:hypothetical protein
VGIPDHDQLQLLHALSTILGQAVAYQTLEVSEEILLLVPWVLPLSLKRSLSLVGRQQQV